MRTFDMEDYSMLSDLAGKLKIPVKERSKWIEKQMTLKIRNEELKLRNKELELSATKRKPNDTSEDQSLETAQSLKDSGPPQPKKDKMEDVVIVDSPQPEIILIKGDLKDKSKPAIKRTRQKKGVSKDSPKSATQSNAVKKVTFLFKGDKKETQKNVRKKDKLRFTYQETLDLFNLVLQDVNWTTVPSRMSQKNHIPRTDSDYKAKLETEFKKLYPPKS
ncbi:uncharacterized protein LOC106058613 isoform X1 [Biomphalaria glabrata]|uniref:Uncharacterized protein LOC106058613 isoform X1 n=2 Tax=Biomphalaria glabrata TaxID=6526 RepID=A0A9W2Z6P1_BIOGL|nr:uncharacterized protein LOC106058613 isoform X1 [Biomphalaria glabrata]